MKNKDFEQEPSRGIFCVDTKHEIPLEEARLLLKLVNRGPRKITILDFKPRLARAIRSHLVRAAENP